MTKEDFRLFVDKTLKELKQLADLYADKSLPDVLQLTGLSNNPEVIEGHPEIVNAITEKVYISEDKIYPCVDLMVVCVTNDNKLRIQAQIASLQPRPFQKGWSNRPGPFIYGVSQKLISPNVDPKSEKFMQKLRDNGLIYY